MSPHIKSFALGRIRIALALACLLPVVLASCEKPDNGPTPPRVDPSRVKVVLVVLDALRADGLGCYGYRRPTSPHIDDVAEDGIVFENCHAASPWTAPAFGSILTGVSPMVHGFGRLTREKSPSTYQASGVRITKLRQEIPTLAQLIGDVTSAAILTNAFLDPSVGIARGFKHYDLFNPYGAHKAKRRADGVTRAAVRWMSDHRDKSFFLMLHYFDAHIPYHPPEDYRRKFAAEQVGRIGTQFASPKAVRLGEFIPTSEERSHIRDLYDGEVRFMDDWIGALVDSMDDLGILEESWLVLTADHGEEHFDHGGFEHGHRYEEEVSRIPLIIRPPGGRWHRGERIRTSVRQIDLLPTVLEWFSKKPPALVEGRSLVPVIAGRDRADRLAYMEFNLYGNSRCALYDGRYKLIQNLDWQLDLPSPMFDLRNDPGERKALDAGHPAYAAMQEELAAYRRILRKSAAARQGEPGSVALDPEVEKSLRALGYVE